MTIFDPTNGSVFVSLFVIFALFGLLYFVVYDRWFKGYSDGPLFGRAMMGAGLFFFFFCLIFIVAYGASNGADLYDSQGKINLSSVRGDFTLGLFVALKDVGTPIGVALGFLSLAWGRFLDLTLDARKQAEQKRKLSDMSEQISALSILLRDQSTTAINK